MLYEINFHHRSYGFGNHRRLNVDPMKNMVFSFSKIKQKANFSKKFGHNCLLRDKLTSFIQTDFWEKGPICSIGFSVHSIFADRYEYQQKLWVKSAESLFTVECKIKTLYQCFFFEKLSTKFKFFVYTLYTLFTFLAFF